MAVQSEQQKNDYAQTVFYADRLLKADPKNAFALVTLASETARHTRENDLDKDEQLAKVDKWAKDAIEAAKVMPKVRADVPDADWEGVQEGHGSPGLRGHGHGRCGAEELRRRRHQLSSSPWRSGATPNPATMVRLAQVYMSTGKLDDAVFHSGQGHQHSRTFRIK